MSIKDQCQRCRYLGDNGCQKTTIDCDGHSCDMYQSRIDLSKTDSSTTIPNNDAQYPQSAPTTDNNNDVQVPCAGDTNIHGWLTFFLCCFVGIGSVASLIMILATSSISEYDGNIWLYLCDIGYGIFYLITGVYTIYSFYSKKCNAVFLGKFFVVLCFLSNIISLIGSDEGTTTKVVTQSIRSLVWCLIWFVYLCRSKQVREIFPKGYRKSLSRDYYLIAASILIPVAMLAIGIASERNSHSSQESAAIASINLQEDERTDGKILFTIPYGWDCDESEANGLTIFTLSNAETGAETNIVADYDTDATKHNFNDYWRSWKMDDLNNYHYTVAKDDKIDLNGKTIFVKTLSINADSTVYWEYILIFDKTSGKVCILSTYYSEWASSPSDDIIKSLRFI
jgi:hypothetical protein